MKTSPHLLPLAVMLAALLPAATAMADSGPPPLPPDPILDSYSFLDTNWDSDYGYPPIGFSNLVWTPEWEGNALMLDTTNETEFPAFLNYNITETNGHVNLRLDAGAVLAVVIPDWSSADTNQLGQGPGGQSYLLTAGDFSSGSPQGLWAIYVDAGGTNLYFGGVSNSVATTYVTAPISWAAGEIHEIFLTYSTNSALYLDGQWAATGGPVTVVPSTNTLTNGFFVGSDASGYEQARCVFWYLELENSNFVQFFGTNYFTGNWEWLTNGYDTWLNPVIAGFQSGFGSSSDSQLPPTPTNTVNTNFAAYTNFWLLATNPGAGVQVSLVNPCLGLTYVILTNARLEPISSTNWQPWITLTGTSTVMPTRPMRPASNTLFFCAELIPSTGTNGLADWWCMEYFGSLNVDPYADPDGDGLCNLTEYLLGTNPTNAHSISRIHNDSQALFLGYVSDAACRYHISVTNGPDTNTLLVTMWPTQIGTNYQIYSKDASVTGSAWRVETNFLGTNTATTVAIPINGRSLSLIGGYGEDTDGDGLPDGYEALATLTDPYLPDTGLTGIPDGYKDPDGDGYVNLEEYYNGTDPHVFDMPAGPQNLLAYFTDGGNILTFTWRPAPGPVLGYVIYVFQGDDPWTPLATNNANQLSYVITNPGSVSGWLANNGEFAVQAIYANGGSSLSYGGPVQYTAMAQAQIVCGPGGRPYLLTSAANSNVTGYTVSLLQEDGGFPEIATYYQNFTYLNQTFEPNFYLPASRFTNGTAILTEEEAPAYSYVYGASLQPRSPGRVTWQSIQNPGCYNTYFAADPFVDGTAQMRQNACFLLRAAGNAPFGYTCNAQPGTENAGYYYATTYPSDHVVSTYYLVFPGYAYIQYGVFIYSYWGISGTDYGGWTPAQTLENHFEPFEDNYFYLNLAFNSGLVDRSGYLDTGFYPWWNTPGPNSLIPTCQYDQTNSLQFQFPTYNYVTQGSNASIPAVLTPDATPWVGYFQGGYGIGQSYPTLPANALNLYGLPYHSLELTYSGSNGIYFQEATPGNTPPDNGGLPCYLGTEQPQLQTVDYYFGRQGIDPMPGYQDGSFAVTNPTPLLLGSTGNPMKILGFAKQAVVNSSSNVFAYLGQYFTNAFVMSNGVITTNPAGIVSEYGNFFPTVPGHIALFTKPDPDRTNSPGVCELDIIRLSLDVNHDGIMDESYTGPDNTGYGAPYVLWANNDYDRWHTDILDGTVQDSLQTAAQPDYDYAVAGNRAIPCPRDLEDFARLWVSGVSNTLSRLPSGSTVTLSWNITPNWYDGSLPYTGNPAIDLFQAADADGGVGYLTNLATASNQINTNLCQYIGRLGLGSNITLNASTFSNNWAGDHYIWCGVTAGTGELDLKISDGSGNVLAQSSQIIQIQDIKQMYERWTVGDNDDNKPLATAAPMTSPDPVADGQPKFRYPDDPAYDTNDTYILFVHGYNMAAWEKDCFAQTAYKRLYWQGYQGRFGEFRWPTYNSAALFVASERQAWLSGTGLLHLLGTLNTNYPGNVYLLAHSLGNIVAGQALRQAGANQLVNTYVASQAALSARAYDNTIPTDAAGYYTPISPDSTGHYYSNTSPPYFNGIAGAVTFVNFINTNDWALMGDNLFAGHPGWLAIQQGKLLLTTQPISSSNPQDYWYTTPSSDHPSGYYYQNGPTSPYRNLLFTNDTFEIFTEAAQSYSLALGAETATVNHFNALLSVNLFGVPYNFGDTHYGHSLEFRSDYMTTDLYWQRLLQSFGLKN